MTTLQADMLCLWLQGERKFNAQISFTVRLSMNEPCQDWHVMHCDAARPQWLVLSPLATDRGLPQHLGEPSSWTWTCP